MSLGIGIGVRRHRGNSLGSYWTTHYISAMSLLVTGATTKTITATLVGSGFTGVSFEYSADLATWTVKGTSVNGVYNATELTAGTRYYWRARLYKGTNYGAYSSIITDMTLPAAVMDGTTKATYDFTNEAAVIKSGDLASQGIDLIGTNHIVQAGADNLKPTWSKRGLAGDGIAKFIKTATFDYNQAESIYLVIKVIAPPAASGIIVDGGEITDGRGVLWMYMATSTTKYCLYAGLLVSSGIGWTVGTFQIVRYSLNTTLSYLKVGAGGSGYKSVGTKNMDGITLFADPLGANPSNVEIKGGIFREGVQDAEDETAIYNYLIEKYFYSTFNAGDKRAFVPKNYVPGNKVIIYFYGAGEDEDAPVASKLLIPTMEAFMSEGWVVLSCLAGGNNWGNAASITAYYDLITWFKASFINATWTDVNIYAQSMGGLSGLQMFMADTQFTKFIGIYPVCNLANMYLNATYKTQIKTAYGIVDDSEYAAKTAGHDPMLLSGDLLGGRKIELVASEGDLVVNKDANTDLFNTTFGALANITVIESSGTHGDVSNFNLARDVAFLKS